MLINTEKSSIELSGDIKEYKTSIDPKNLDFITTLLSSNLYSNPEQSFIREIVSNAWDSHVEAGTTDTPVLIKLDKNNRSIIIRDFGTGLSPQRFEEIYCNIGSSTKRDSNEYIGGFGLGRFSSLACSDTTYIDSYYEGIVYKYIMTKSGNEITYNKVLELPTTEPNGVEVSIKEVYNFSKFEDALGFIRFFPNVYIEGYDVINTMKIKNYKYFKCSSLSTNYRFLLGNVLYPCDYSQLSTKSQQFLNTLLYTGIVIKFNVGEVNITPNRESIIYTTETIKKIEQRIAEAEEELYQILRNHFSKDHDDLFEYFNAANEILSYDFVTEQEISKSAVFNFRACNIPNMSITYKNKDLSNFMYYIRHIRNTKLPQLKGVIYYNTFYTTRFNYNVEQCIKCSSNDIIILKNTGRLIAGFKSYLKDHYKKCAIIQEFTVEDLKVKFEELRKHEDSALDFTYLATELYNRILSKSKTIDINTDKDFLQYKQELKEGTVKLTSTKKVILYIYNPNSSYYGTRIKYDFANIQAALVWLKALKAGLVIDNLHDMNYDYSKFCCTLGYYYVTASQETCKLLKDNPLKSFTTISYILNHNKTLRITNTLSSLSEYLHSSVLHYLPNHLLEQVYQIKECYNSQIYIPFSFTDKIPVDTEALHIIKQIQKYDVRYASLVKITDTHLLDIPSNMKTALIIKLKLFRVNSRVYSNMKKDKIIQLLCKK